MTKMTKRKKAVEAVVTSDRLCSLEEAVELLKKCPEIKFDQTVDIAIKLGIDPKKTDQNVRSTVSLPSGTGKKVAVLVLARGDKLKEAEEAGADFFGSDDLVEKISKGWTEFDAVIATPDMMREVGKLGKILGPRGLMPTPKAGTVTTDVTKAVQEIRQGRIEFKNDKAGIVNCGIGKLTAFSAEQIIANARALVAALMRAKPSTAKGVFIQKVCLSSTMGPGISIDMREFETARAR